MIIKCEVCLNWLFHLSSVKYWQWKTKSLKEIEQFCFLSPHPITLLMRAKKQSSIWYQPETSGGDVMTTVSYLKISGNLIAFHFLFKTTFLLRLLMTLNKHKKQLMDGCRSMWHTDNESVLLQWLVTITPLHCVTCKRKDADIENEKFTNEIFMIFNISQVFSDHFFSHFYSPT